MIMRALPINVYRDGDNYDCTNGGISSIYDTLLMLCPDGYKEVDGTEPNLVRVVTMKLGSREHKYLEPVNGKRSDAAGWMSGGNIGYTCDSRFPSQYPLMIHDRQEPWEQYYAITKD